MPEKRKYNLAEAGRGLYYNQKKWLREFLDNNVMFYNGIESDDSDNDDKNYNENMKAVVHTCSSKWVFLEISLSNGFFNSCYKIVSRILLQELISNFAVCKIELSFKKEPRFLRI